MKKLAEHEEFYTDDEPTEADLEIYENTWVTDDGEEKSQKKIAIMKDKRAGKTGLPKETYVEVEKVYDGEGIKFVENEYGGLYSVALRYKGEEVRTVLGSKDHDKFVRAGNAGDIIRISRRVIENSKQDNMYARRYYEVVA